jgi:paraquat-inducible protein A
MPASSSKSSSQNITESNQLIIVSCHECAHLVHLPAIPNKHKALCPRCGFNLTTQRENALQWVCALAITALILLIASLPFQFLSFSAGGQTQNINILAGIKVLFTENYALLGLLQAIAILILPALILCAVILLLVPLQFGIVIPKAGKIAKLVFCLLPWSMAEIFLIGVLVSLIKISSLADIAIGLSFYAFLLFTLSMTAMLMFLDEHQLLLAINEKIPTKHQPINASMSIQTTWALLFTSILLYIPANILPIMVTQSFGDEQASTIIGGVILLWQSGSYPIAMIIFVASVLIPIAKIVILCWLNYSVQQEHQQGNYERMRWYRLTEFVGRWSMIDVFVVAVLVSLIQLGSIMSIHPGYAAIAFCAVVIMTMLAAMSFDTRLIWHKELTPHE